MNLTDRQREIVELLLATGTDRRVVAQRLGMSADVLRAHLTDIRKRLGVDTDAAMMARIREMNRDPVSVQLARCRAEPRQWYTV